MRPNSASANPRPRYPFMVLKIIGTRPVITLRKRTCRTQWFF